VSRYDFTPWLIALGFLYLGWVFRRELAALVLAAVDFLVYGTDDPEVSGGAEDALGASGLGTAPPEVSFSEALKPVGGAPSWESVRRER